MVRCLWAILPPTLLWGASFPLAIAAIARRGEDPGKSVGSVYAANTLGAIVGALGVSLVLIPWIGTQDSQRALLWLSLLSGVEGLHAGSPCGRDAFHILSLGAGFDL